MALILILYTYPGGFFVRTPLAFFGIPGIGEIHFYILFVFFGFLKFRKSKVPFFLHRNVVYILLYLLVLVFIFGLTGLPTFLRVVIAWSIIYLVPKILHDYEKRIKFYEIILFSTFIVFAMNLYEIIIGLPLGAFADSEIAFGGMRIDDEDFSRPVYGMWISLFSLYAALKFLASDEQHFSSKYLYSIIIVSILSVFISATRGWIVALVILLGFYLFFQKQAVIKRSFGVIIVMIVLLTIGYQLPVLNKQINASIERLLFSKDVIAGDMSDEATGGRFSSGQKVMRGFYESPIIGLGLGEESKEYFNVHTGNQTMLMRYGIIGFSLFVLLWVIYLSKLYSRARDHDFTNGYRNQMRMNMALFLAVFFIHSTSGLRLDLMIQHGDAMWVALIFAIASIDYYDYPRYLKRTQTL